jgi:beta-1,4-mannosyl-glycoprotein beta-1,4-N-acetylglucosaminyltransferase
MKIIDVFPFFNELDILEIRLNILDPYVDYFILSESTKTFSGLDKPLFYKENKKKFEKFNHKIIHNVIEYDPSSEELSEYGKRYNNTVEAQQRDIYQKDSIKNVIFENCDKDDIILWGDADEVPNPEVIEKVSEFFESETISSRTVEFGSICSGQERH